MASPERASKRARLVTDANEAGIDPLVKLGVLAEVVSVSTLPGSLDLVSHLLETLRAINDSERVDVEGADKTFIEQSLMGVIESVVDAIMAKVR